MGNQKGINKESWEQAKEQEAKSTHCNETHLVE